VAPFDTPTFAKGLMEDVTLLFLPPQVKPRNGGRKRMVPGSAAGKILTAFA